MPPPPPQWGEGRGGVGSRYLNFPDVGTEAETRPCHRSTIHSLQKVGPALLSIDSDGLLVQWNDILPL